MDFIGNTKLVLVASLFISWFLFTAVGYLLKLTNQQKDVNLTILKWVPIGFSASIFIAITIGVSINKFDPENFCLMNSQDGLCSSVETNCFRKSNHSESLFTSDFGFGKFLVINSTNKRDIGKGYTIRKITSLNFNTFVSEKEVPGVASCTTTAQYIDYYVDQYNPGKLGIQPHNFVIKDGEQIKVEYIKLEYFKTSDISGDNFEWLTSQTNYTIEKDRSYRSITDDTKSNGSTFVFKTNGADISIILRHDFIKPQKMNITSAFFAPFGDKKLTKTVNLKTGIFCAQ